MMVPIFTLNISAELVTISVVKNTRGHAMRAILTALLLTGAMQAGADDAKLNPDEWSFLECKHAEGALLEIVTGENASLSLILAISKDENHNPISCESHIRYHSVTLGTCPQSIITDQYASYCDELGYAVCNDNRVLAD